MDYDINIEQEGEGIKARIVKIKGTRNYRIYIKGVKKPFVYKLAEKNTEADLRRNYEFIIKKLLAMIPKRRARKPKQQHQQQPISIALPGATETIITQLRQRELERENKAKEPPKDLPAKESTKEEVKEPPKTSLIKRITSTFSKEPKKDEPKEIKYLGSNKVEVKFMDSGNIYRGDADEFVKKFTANPELIKKLNKDIEDERKKITQKEEELKNANQKLLDKQAEDKRKEEERTIRIKKETDNKLINKFIKTDNYNRIAKAVLYNPDEFKDILKPGDKEGEFIDKDNIKYRFQIGDKDKAIQYYNAKTKKWTYLDKNGIDKLLKPKMEIIYQYTINTDKDYAEDINKEYKSAGIEQIDIPNIRTEQDLAEQAKQIDKKRKADEEAGENTALTIAAPITSEPPTTIPEPTAEEAAGMDFPKDVEPGDVIITQRDSNFTPSEEFTKLMDTKVQEYAEKNKPSSWVRYVKGMMEKEKKEKEGKGNKEGKNANVEGRQKRSGSEPVRNLTDYEDRNGTTTTELTEYADKLNIPHFQGVLPFDYLKSLKPAPMISAIFNLDNSNQLGSHWCALIIGNGKIEYYDSLCMNKKVPELLEHIKHVLPRTPQETKLNHVRHQYESGSNCGWFCLKFLNDRLNKGQTWAQATDFEIFTKARKNEKDVEEFKRIIKDYSTDDMIGGAEIHRVLSDTAYTPADERPAELSDYKYNRALSDDRTAVYFKEGEKPIIAYRGTVPTNKLDLKDDVKLIFGTLKNTKRVKSAIDTAKKVESEYGVKPAITGHSLAGAVAEIVGNKTGADTITYSKGTSPLPFTTPSQKRGKSRIIEHNINLLDPISVLGTIKNKAKNIVITTPKSLNPHSLLNYKSGTKN